MASGGAGTAPLPHPPPAHPLRTKAFEGPYPTYRWYRVHRHDPLTGDYGPVQFNDTDRGSARFSPLVEPATGRVIPVIYAAATVDGAIAEIVLHDIPTPSTGHNHDWERDKAGSLHLSHIGIDLAALQLVNLTTTGLKAAGLEVADLFGAQVSDYPRTRAWALHIWQTLPHAQGLYWMSVRDNTSPVLMLFGDRIHASVLSDLGNSLPIARYESNVLALLDGMGCGLAIP